MKGQRITFRIDNPEFDPLGEHPGEKHLSLPGRLLYWGTKSEHAVVNQQGFVFTYTVGLCMHEDTGDIYEVLPPNIKFINPN